MHQPDDMFLRLEVLPEQTDVEKHGTLAYLIELAMLEAKKITDDARRREIEERADPRDLLRPW